MVNVYKILKETTVEGPGNRFCIWVQGCKKHCPECWAKDTWNFGCGKEYSIEKLFKMMDKSKIEGITFLGGEPFEQAKELSKLSQMVKEVGLSVVCFTGYTIEELQAKKDIATNSFLENIDLLIDGGFEIEKYDLSRPWIGSSNQRYLFLTDRYSLEEILKYKNKIEVRISQGFLMDTKTITQLSKLFRARFPYIYITTWEEDRAISLIKKMAKSEKLIRIPREVYIWTQTNGFMLDGQKIEGTQSPDKAIDFISECNKNAIFVMCDFHIYFGVKGRQVDYNVVRRLRDNISDLKTSKFRKNVIFIASELLIPETMQKEITILDMPLPTLD